MGEVLDPPRWQAVGLVIDQNQRDFLAGRSFNCLRIHRGSR